MKTEEEKENISLDKNIHMFNNLIKYIQQCSGDCIKATLVDGNKHIKKYTYIYTYKTHF